MSRVFGPKKGVLSGRSGSVSSEDSRSSGRSAGAKKGKDEGAKKKADIEGSRSTRERGGRKTLTNEPKVSAEGTSFMALPKLAATPPEEQGELFIRKLRECCTIHVWKATEKQLPEKEGKRQTLIELMDTVNERKPSIWLDEKVLTETLDMIGANLFRTLTKRERLLIDLADADEEDPAFDPAWPHLELVYEMLQRLVSCKDVEASYLARFFNSVFISRIVELTDSDDPREREVLKTVLRRMQDKLTALRSQLRRAIQVQLQLALADGNVVNGFPEMLEIFARFVHSFSTPLKEEHRDVFRRIILPLHKVEWLAVFHSQLLDVLKKYIEKDSSLSLEVVKSLLHFWPARVSTKQILFLGELDDMIGQLPSGELKKMQPALGRVMVECLTCINSDVADKALVLWKSDKFLKLIFSQCRDLVPGIISALYNNATQHWQQSVHVRTVEVLKLMLERDPELFDSSSAAHRKACEEKEKKEALREKRWAWLQTMHDRKMSMPAATTNEDVRGSPRSDSSPSPQRGRPQSTAVTNAATKAADSENQRLGASPPSRRSSRVAGHGGSPRPPIIKGLALLQDRYGIAISWCSGEATATLALQAALVDGRGRIVEAVCSRNPVAASGAVVLRGEDVLELEGMHKERTGTLWLSLGQLPTAVAAVVVVVSTDVGKMQDLELCDIHVVEGSRTQTMAHFIVEPLAGVAAAVSVVRRDGQGQWAIARLCESSKAGRHVVDMVEPAVGKVIRESVPSLPKRHKSMLSVSGLGDGGVVVLPLPNHAKYLFVGMSWDLASDHRQHDAHEDAGLAVAALFLDRQGQVLGVADADGGGEVLGVRHGGRGVTGQGCIMDLAAAPADTSQVFLVGFALSEKATVVDMLQKVCCCVVDPAGAELLRYRLPEGLDLAEKPAGWMAGRFIGFQELSASSETVSRWCFQALGLPCAGTSWEASLEEIQGVFRQPPSSYQTLPPDLVDVATSRVVSL